MDNIKVYELEMKCFSIFGLPLSRLNRAPQGSFMDLLSKEFALLHPPLFKRRAELFKFTQQPGELFSSFIRRFDDAWQSAEMEDVAREQLKAILLVAATRDQELLDLFLELKEPTLQQLEDIGFRYEGRKRMMAQLFPKRKSRSRGGKNRR